MKEKLILLAPNSVSTDIYSTWFVPEDKQNLITKTYDVLNRLPVDRSKIYCFGHSLGATRALDWGFANRNSVAAVALHSPYGQAQGIYDLKAEPGSRRLPLGIWVGEESCDANWHCGNTLQCAYREHPNFLIDLKVIANHHHNDIYVRPNLTDEIWSFLKQYSL